ncbi:ABC transporter [Adlercreutzia equolifaciens subsp. celatus]|uniref:ABC transporter n=1 Tax=Adlercreutzia equolifaciens subsp. celatus DSM 18785 TaxID=1121021 RepID=A0A3N0AXM2_9ACTN|nr:AarF/UbiB family protein [Adlercreutzia equolifaciens]MCP2077916.1 ubiquinone biosynthesis protein [Adlercreutzia equolifaciens subsp. celatus DSM 18785]RFT94837.1 AarF/ABC1/UbiB kinase family protein [Adlercreutzia equolifaciens subsp. celatus]RNL39324.1 ABC transporter [Adlercreutzia equolifaciens subsp. celatus DSM 18785]BCS58426.1 ABC transporter [Adlercreutzia equolifaciens subsp. celatus]
MATFEEFMKVAEISIKDKTSHKRMNEIARIMRQYKVLHGLTPEQAVEVLQALGPTYVKIGQLASNRSDLLPKAYCDAFEKLRDDANPMPFDVVIEQIDRAYGKSWHEVFASIDPVPLGAASIAQVHKATLLDGTTVAVKVRRPGVAESMAEDIMLMKHLLALGEFASNSHRDILLSLEGFIEEIERTTASEVDFTSELHNLMRFHDELADEQGVTSPVAYPQYSCESVLVMEFVQGTEISHTEELCQQGVDMNALARRVCQSYVTQVLDDGFFHADPHPGNILVRDGDVVWIDLGMVGTLTVSERMLVGKVFTAVATDNAYLLKEAVMGLVHVLGPVDHGALLEALSRLLAEYSTAEMKEINVGTVLTEVIEVLRGQNMMMTSSVTMLARGFVTIEGVMAQVAPDISVIEIVSKHVIAQQADPKFLATQLIDLATTSAASAEALAKLPTQLSNTLEMLDRGQIKVNGDIEVSSRILATAYASVGRISLALLSAGLFLGSSILCTTAMQPQLLGVPLLGVLGYVGAFVLGAYTVFHILVSRHRLLNNEEPR